MQLNNSLGGLQFGIDENGNYGYIKAGADSVLPFKKGYEMTIIGQFYDTTNGGLIQTTTLFSGNVVPMSNSTFRIQGYGHIYADIIVSVKED